MLVVGQNPADERVLVQNTLTDLVGASRPVQV
jgi:hypothetical protein